MSRDWDGVPGNGAGANCVVQSHVIHWPDRVIKAMAVDQDNSYLWLTDSVGGVSYNYLYSSGGAQVMHHRSSAKCCFRCTTAAFSTERAMASFIARRRKCLPIFAVFIIAHTHRRSHDSVYLAVILESGAPSATHLACALGSICIVVDGIGNLWMNAGDSPSPFVRWKQSAGRARACEQCIVALTVHLHRTSVQGRGPRWRVRTSSMFVTQQTMGSLGRYASYHGQQAALDRSHYVN